MRPPATSSADWQSSWVTISSIKGYLLTDCHQPGEGGKGTQNEPDQATPFGSAQTNQENDRLHLCSFNWAAGLLKAGLSFLSISSAEGLGP